MEALRHALLALHRALIEHARIALERERGRQTATELWKLLVADPELAWLRSLSEVIVRIDEALDGTAIDEGELRAMVRGLLVADAEGGEFQRRYAEALQGSPDAVLAHRAATRVL